MQTTMTILQPDGTTVHVELDMAPRPSLHDIQAVLAPYFGRAYTEHVRILGEDGEYTDMFVDENGLITGLPRNEKATEHYRRNWLKQRPDTPPERLGFIVGTAVLFDRQVWF